LAGVHRGEGLVLGVVETARREDAGKKGTLLRGRLLELVERL
jgi:hypothetical protein